MVVHSGASVTGIPSFDAFSWCLLWLTFLVVNRTWLFFIFGWAYFAR